MQGNRGTDVTRIVRSFEVPPGSHYSADAVRRGIRKLFALGLFSDVFVTEHRHPDDPSVVDLVVHVKERPRIGRVTFSGNRRKQTADLEKKLVLHAGETFTPTALEAQTDSLLRFYHDEGYANATVVPEIDTLTTPNTVGVRYVIHEGEKVRITRIVFVGNHAFSDKKLRKRMKTKKKGFFGGGEVKEENFPLDKERVERFYHSHGYRDARWIDYRLSQGESPKKMTMTVTVDEGRPYTIGTVTWHGNQVIPGDDLAKLWVPKRDEPYDISHIEKVQGQAYAEYAEKGYLYLGIEPQENVRDSVVDVAYQVQEGRPSNVRLVNIRGNKGTREKVIRRELSIHEGDRFKRSLLVRTQGDIMRLGLFEDVQIDFAPAESTDVDINLKVKEKQVGTASAGAGYTNQAGLTGFLELGHNNVLGNGQSVSLHLERGSRLSNYYLSFTEPWFHDTPTLLGFSAFNSTTDQDLYVEQRVGGSGSIGRPLPWPDYSRGSLSYSIETIKITQLGTTLTPQDSVALSGVQVGKALLTSSLQINFLRNTTDNPFYPTKGSRLSLNTELAGGPFGGSISYHKHRIEGRVYLPSFAKPFTTMLRARVGLLGEYPDQHTQVPPYERFRLGGGTTPDPVRGYMDYQIVPAKFIQEVVVAYDTTFSGPDSGKVTPVFQKVRYPGGRYMTLYTMEQEFPIVLPLRGVLFVDAGNTWDLWREIQPFKLKWGAGAGIRLEIPLLGNIGFDYGYGFNRDDGPRAVGHFLLGNVNF